EGMQRKLLRVLQEGVIRPIGSKQTVKVDTRIICASNRNLQALVKSGAFRVDLFYRVNVISIEIPPLRERIGDLRHLAARFLAEIEAEEGLALRISAGALKALEEYAWPGNVRELRNVIRRAAVTCGRRAIARKDVAPLLEGGPPAGFQGEGLDRSDTQLHLTVPRRESFNEIIGECERVVILNALKECRWNKSKVVKALKIPRQSLYNMIAKHDLQRSWDL
ncbi:MAG: sigma 54-interacting transcriptional regulator, partial [Thermoanaerobaculia bacterium]